MRRWLKRLVVVLGLALGLLLLAGIGGGLWLDRQLDASLPVLEGKLRLAGLDQKRKYKKKIDRIEPSISSFVVFLGVRRVEPTLAVDRPRQTAIASTTTVRSR